LIFLFKIFNCLNVYRFLIKAVRQLCELTAVGSLTIRKRTKKRMVSISRIIRDFPVASVGEQSDPGITVRKHWLTVKYQQVLPTQYGRDRIGRRQAGIYVGVLRGSVGYSDASP